jgi:1,4-dihydroxy-6-naphthoate synthase
MMSKISRHLHASIAYALEHRLDALDHAMKFARGLDRSKADEFVGMYVNDWTLDYGPRGREAIRLFLDRAWKAGLIPNQVIAEFVGE